MSTNGTEARSLMAEAGAFGRGTVLDESHCQRVMRKWSNYVVEGQTVNFLKGLSPRNAAVTALCMENQAKYFNELSEDTLSTNSGTFQKYIFPIVRRLFPNLILNDIATVQPMSAPSGAMFTRELRHDDRKGSMLPWTGITNNPYDMSYQGETAASTDAIKNFAQHYGDEYIDYDVVCTDTGTTPAALANTDSNCRTVAWFPIRAPGTSGQRTFSVKLIYRVLNHAGTAPITITATLASTGSNLVDQYSKVVGTFTIATGAWSITAYDETGVASTFTSNKAIYAQYYVNSELTYTVSGNRLQRMSINLTRHDIVAEPHRVSAAWSLDAVYAMRSQHGLDLEAELVADIANEIACEIDRKGIAMMIAGAGHAATYTYTASYPGDMEAVHGLMTQVDAVSAWIQKTGGRGPANFLVMDPVTASLLGQMSYHKDWQWSDNQSTDVPPSHGDRNSQYPIQRMGTTFNGKYRVYVDPWHPEGTILVGYKGSTWLDAGLGYAPYVPLFATDTWTNPDTMMQSKGMASLYALKLLRNEYYGTVTVSGLPTVTHSL